ncbi:isoprenylcysteine carboxyl methyltransferase family protein [Bacillus sp. J14TS2]|uniref:isoprenylcysteine carboxyl methyltransferase family protein n=1 Tax=Bacillus sp. J14TS2 TaxID=2807188 RepID=UPI001BB36F3F|nr:isoprenylcysteine carboxylmethyltransferase family protein [Bacillus sp. J14TS2]
MFFLIILTFLLIQRLTELFIARQNERWMLQHGAIIYGQSHYPYMILLHVGFFLFFIVEVVISGQRPARFWPIFLSIFFLLQFARYWVIISLGKYWNTKIIVLPNAALIRKGPFRFIKHPNYMIVTLELLVVPLMFHAYITAILFFFLNQWMLFIRIREEDQALQQNLVGNK